MCYVLLGEGRAAVAVVEQHAPIILDIVFTTIEEFAVPTTGFNMSHRNALAA